MIAGAQKIDHEIGQEQPAALDAPAKVRVPKPSNKAPSAFRTISEVADTLSVHQHVLRFWETKFSQIRPLKRGGGRRYYRPEDVALITRIHHLLYTEGYTIKGVQKLLKGQGVRQAAVAVPIAEQTDIIGSDIVAAGDGGMEFTDTARATLRALLKELKALRAMVRT